jgi:hypothetical protein
VIGQDRVEIRRLRADIKRDRRLHRNERGLY